jgi:hypothetical protein
MQVIQKPFFYSREIKRTLIQLLGCFSGYRVETGTQYDGESRLLPVPMIFGNQSRLAGFVLRGGSDNSMPYLPMGALNMIGLKRDDNQRRTPYHSEKFNYIERAMDPEGRVIVGVEGTRKTVERFMPVPYLMDFELAFWCSNQDQMFQIMEQIGAAYAVQMDVLISNSPADWTNLNTILWNGEFRFGHAIPEGSTETDPYHTVTLPFVASIWLGAPVKVYETKYIEKIQLPIYELAKSGQIDDSIELDQLVITPSEDQLVRFENLAPAPEKKPQD